MTGRRELSRRWGRWGPRALELLLGVTLVLVPLLVSCGGGEPGESEEASAAATGADQPSEQAPATQQVAVHAFTREGPPRNRAPIDFPHAPHVGVQCSVCHQSPAGHSVHTPEIACADCHAQPNVSPRRLTPEECQSCHHGVNQTRTCQACHGEPVPLMSTQTLAFEVWDQPRERELQFDHDRHAQLECATCHNQAPSLTPRTCGSCHDEHHTGAVACASCHVEPPAGAHDAQVHLSCSGAGCHRERGIEAISTTRPVCLACHRAQTDHQPGEECIDCHKVRGEAIATHAWGAR